MNLQRSRSLERTIYQVKDYITDVLVNNAGIMIVAPF
jgi:NADP-dependent 3-hydroxy acid dehydrogenase YdfG